MIQRDYNFYEFGPFRLDATERVLIRHGEPVHLTPKALKLLLVLVQNGNHIVDKDELMRQVWPDTVVEETNLAGNIHALRQILGENNNEERYIETIPTRGYRFVAKVREGRGGDRSTANQHSTSANAVQSGKVNESKLSRAIALAAQMMPQALRALLTKVIAVVVVLSGLLAVIYFWALNKATPPEPNLKITSIAVLPLKNLSVDASEEYFADGMTEAVINELAKIGALRVISRQSIMQYKSAPKTMREIARELNVDAVVEGSVLRSNSRVRITAQLIRASTDEHLWAESYERDLRDVLALQRDIARGITDEIRTKLTPREQVRLASADAVHPAAHEQYLKGLYWLNRAINESHTQEIERLHKKSFEHFQEAIKFDPNYALAHSALARSYHFLASDGFPDFYVKAKESALKAIAIDDNLAEAHGALAYTVWRHEWNFAQAEKEFQRAEQLESNSYFWGYAQFLSTIGRHEEAIRRYRLAQDLDPLTVSLRASAARAYLDARQYDHAIAQFKDVLELDPKLFGAHTGLGTAYVLKGMYEEGIAEFQKGLDLSGQARKKVDLAWAYAMAGRQRQAINIVNDMKGPPKQNSIPDISLAAVYVALDEKDLAIAQLETAYAKRRGGLLWLKVDLRFERLHSDPRFTSLLRRIGFPE